MSLFFGVFLMALSILLAWESAWTRVVTHELMGAAVFAALFALGAWLVWG